MEFSSCRIFSVLLAVLACAAGFNGCAKLKAPSDGGGAAATAVNGLNGTWIAGCTTALGIAGAAPPASTAYTSKIQVSGSNLTYTVQGYVDATCVTVGNSLVYNFAFSATGTDTVVAGATDLGLIVSSSSICAPNCVSNGGVGALYQGLYLISGKTLNINWAFAMRPLTLGNTFTLL